MKEYFSFLFEIFKIVLIALLIVIPIRYFLFQPFIVRGDSMEPNFQNGDYLLIDEISFRFRDPKRGEVIIFRPPTQDSARYIKRIIGLPGETVRIEDSEVLLFDGNADQILDESSYLLPSTLTPGNLTVSLGENEYFVLGDNRQFSSDSRRWGALKKENITGRAFLRAWPAARFTRIIIPSYSY